AVGCLSVANLPKFRGLDSFKGTWYHTGHWPHEPVSFHGQRVAVIGTGATGVQVVPEIAREAAHVYVFQRTPNFNLPAHNRPLDPEYIRQVKARYKDIWQKARVSGFGLPYDTVERSALSVTPAEREQIYAAAWNKGGFYFGLETFNDLLFNREANDTAAEFVRARIREIVRDPTVAELLSPRDHAFFTKRPPLEHGYYEAFNRPNVTLIDLRSTPIEEIIPNGVRTSSTEYEVDSIIFATGFDAMTGALLKMNISGRNGMTLNDKWAEGPRTYLGLATHGFPNLFMITGPQSPSVLTNMTVAIEQHVEWIADCLKYLRDNGIRVIEAEAAAEESWVTHARQVAEMTLLVHTPSWWVGANIPGKPRLLYPYVGGLGNYKQQCDAVAAQGYTGFSLHS
uniref:flavin-containing monooxygenase n=1 Tax=uncultured Chloroflexus sp. TaxID=214040 RepID=UPI002610B0DF